MHRKTVLPYLRLDSKKNIFFNAKSVKILFLEISVAYRPEEISLPTLEEEQPEKRTPANEQIVQ